VLFGVDGADGGLRVTIVESGEAVRLLLGVAYRTVPTWISSARAGKSKSMRSGKASNAQSVERILI